MEKTQSSEVKAKSKRIKPIIAVSVCVAVILGIVLTDIIRSSKQSSSTFLAMGTVINVKVTGKSADATISEIENELDTVENSLLSWRSENSDVARINSGAGSAVSVSADTASVISSALSVSSDCNGVFDITIGKITQMWDFGGDNQRVPSKKEIEKVLPSVGYKSITVTSNGVTIGKNQNLDLGAVGKGAACDKIRSLLDNTNTKSAVISVGGSLLLFGNKSFSIGIANPKNDTKHIGTLNLKDTCVSTSGNYEKTFTQGGKTYHHILDARTGYPAESNLTSVTVICHSGVISDALSTSCFILGYENSLKLLKKYNAEAVFIFNDNTVKYTDGIKNSFKVTDNSFKVDL